MEASPLVVLCGFLGSGKTTLLRRWRRDESLRDAAAIVHDLSEFGLDAELLSGDDVPQPECPVDAILSEDDLTDDQMEFLEINAELSPQWPVITVRKDPPEDASEWEDVKDKRQFIDR